MDRNRPAWLAPCAGNVALRKESVDRNTGGSKAIASSITSLSARRAWIEMLLCCTIHPLLCVALRKESVDRNDGKLDADLWVM